MVKEGILEGALISAHKDSFSVVNRPGQIFKKSQGKWLREEMKSIKRFSELNVLLKSPTGVLRCGDGVRMESSCSKDFLKWERTGCKHSGHGGYP